MEREASNLPKKPNHRLPPKRGRVLIGILKNLGGRRKKSEGVAELSSSSSASSSTPAATPTGYNSDAPSES